MGLLPLMSAGLWSSEGSLGCRSKVAKSHAWQLVLAVDGSLARPMTRDFACHSFGLQHVAAQASSKFGA